MGGGAAAHIDQFHIIVPVLGEMGKAGVGADLDKMPFLQQFGVIHHKFFLGCIDAFLNIRMPLKQCFFFVSDLFKILQ